MNDRRRRVAGIAIALIGLTHGASAQSRQVAVTVVDVGPGFPGRLLQAALASPHVIIGPGDTIVHLARGTREPATVIVLGRDVTVASHVPGDVIVVGGDLFVRPGAVIQGRAVAIGGTATNSTLASIRDGRLSYRDETFDIESLPGGGYALRYRALRAPPGPFSFPGFFGFAIPTYDRVNGLSVSFGPSIALDSARLELAPTVTYRTHLGTIDPSLAGRLQLGRRSRMEAWAGRGTFTNDRWIYGDLANSLVTLAFGRDARNYFRGGRVEGRLFRKWEGPTWEHEPFVGARWERATSVGPDTLATSSPWSLFGRTSERAMRRPNPPIREGRSTSVLGGISMKMEPPSFRAESRLETELVLDAPGTGTFSQTTLHARAIFPTFSTHSFEIETHDVFTIGGRATPQRFAYLGGPGTLVTLELLEQGGDQLLFLESRYIVPLTRPLIPYLGPPSIAVRHVVGGAGVGSLPRLEQELGLRVSAGMLRTDIAINPARRKTEFSVSVAIAR